MTDDMGNEIGRKKRIEYDPKISANTIAIIAGIVASIVAAIWGTLQITRSMTESAAKSAAHQAVTDLRIDTLQRSAEADRADQKYQVQRIEAQISVLRAEQHQATRELSQKLDRVLERPR